MLTYFWYIFLAFFPAFFKAFILALSLASHAGILPGILPDIYSDIPPGIPDIYSDSLSDILSGILSDICFGILSGNLSGILSVSHMCSGPVVLVHRVRSWRYGVRAQACPQHPDLAIRCSAPGVPAFGARDMGFGSRRAPQPPGLAVRFGGSGHKAQQVAEMMRRRRRRSCTFVKIWRPSLAGVEKQNLSQPVSLPSFCLTGPSKQTKRRGMQKAGH